MGLLPLAPEASASASSATSAVRIFPDRGTDIITRRLAGPKPGATEHATHGRTYRIFAPIAPNYDLRVTRATLLWILLALFVLRVVGQLLVVTGRAPFLPPMDEWQSGLLPYPVLLSSQIAILALLETVCMQFSRGRGLFVRRDR